MTTANPRGQFVWYELMTTDPKAAIPFYTDVIGWGTQAMEGDMPYTMWTQDGQPLGGTMELPEDAKKMGAPPHWMGYVFVPDIEATVAQAKSLGATIFVPPTEIPNMGRFSIFADPQGAAIAVWEAAMPASGQEPPTGNGRFSWHELMTSDWEAALKFYGALFGWEKMDAMDMGEMGTYLLYGKDGKMLGGMMNKPPEMPTPAWLYYVSVPDLDAAIARAVKDGGKVVNGPMDVPGGDRIVQLLDPQGAMIALHARGAAQA